MLLSTGSGAEASRGWERPAEVPDWRPLGAPWGVFLCVQRRLGLTSDMWNSCQKQDQSTSGMNPCCCSVPHPLPLGPNKILPLSCCPFTNWIKQNRLEFNKYSEWCGLYGIPMVCLKWQKTYQRRSRLKPVISKDLLLFSISGIRTLKLVFFCSALILLLYFFFSRMSLCGLIVSWNKGASFFSKRSPQLLY